MRQTAVTDTNRIDFYRQLYPVQKDTIEELIDISAVDDPIMAIDCCGWHYKDLFDKQIIMVETIKTAHQFTLDKEKFDRLIDDRTDGKIVWPKIQCTRPALLMDRSPLLRYKTVPQISDFLSDLISNYHPTKIFLRGSLLTVDDFRLDDRFYSWQNFRLNGFVVTKFFYDTNRLTWQISLKSRI